MRRELFTAIDDMEAARTVLECRIDRLRAEFAKQHGVASRIGPYAVAIADYFASLEQAAGDLRPVEPHGGKTADFAEPMQAAANLADEPIFTRPNTYADTYYAFVPGGSVTQYYRLLETGSYPEVQPA